MEKHIDRNKTIIRTSLIGIIGNILLVGLKMFIGLLASSISIVLDALNNLTDAVSSIITMIGTKLSTKKPDKKHPFGHGRVEYITTLIIAFIILSVGGISLFQSIKGIISDPLGKQLSDFTYVSIIIIALAIVGKVILSIIFYKNGKKADSEALLATSKDALFDALLSLATLVGIITTLIFKISIEYYLGLIIAGFIIKTGIEILSSSISSIIGERPSNEITSDLKKLILDNPKVCGCYDIILNTYGPNRMIGSAHIEVDANMNAKEIHQLTKEIAESAYYNLGIILTLGIYANDKDNEKSVLIKEVLADILKEYPQVLEIHAFYVNEERKEIGFDLIIDFKDDAKAIKDEIVEKLKNEFPNYTYKVVLDQDFADR